jgi:membrane fusion protein (multidrug efflux system)
MAFLLKGYSTRERTLSVLVPLVLLGCTLFACGCKRKAGVTGTPPALEVGVVSVEQRDVPVYGEWVGNLDGYVNAQIQPQVSGYLVRQVYREGQHVRKGDVLFEIDPRSFQASLDQAQGQLGQARAQLELSQINVKRDTPLVAIHALAQSQLDNDTQQVHQYQSLVKTNEAAIETAQLNLSWTKVRSLIDGIAGRATIQAGNLVSTSTTLTSVSQVNPIKAFFSISEQEYIDLTNSAKRQGAVDLLKGGSKISLELTLANGEKYPGSGSIVFVDRAVDNTTGTILIAGAFSNPSGLLRPGQFAKVRALTSVQKNAFIVPQRAVLDQQGQHLAIVVGANNIAKVQKITVGSQVGQDWIVTSGLNPGDRVVTEGNGKVRDGMAVKPVADNGTTEQGR